MIPWGVVGNGRELCALFGTNSTRWSLHFKHRAVIMSDEEVIEVTVDIAELKKLKVGRTKTRSLHSYAYTAVHARL
jgi:hypothetical protein